MKRFAMIGVLGLVASCDNAPAVIGTRPVGSGSAFADDVAREQARYDAERRPDLVLAAAKIQPGNQVADIGAGSGLLTVHLARKVGKAGKVVATDIDRAVLNILSDRLKREDLTAIVEARVVQSDAPGLAPDMFDVILLAEVDHYFTDASAWLAAAKASLKPGGRFVVTNRAHHRPASMAAAKAAGLVLKAETTPLPSHFIAVFEPPKATL